MKLISSIFTMHKLNVARGFTGCLATFVTFGGAIGVWKNWWSGDEYAVIVGLSMPVFIWIQDRLARLSALRQLKEKENQIINFQDILNIIFDLKADGNAPIGGKTDAALKQVVIAASEAMDRGDAVIPRAIPVTKPGGPNRG